MSGNQPTKRSPVSTSVRLFVPGAGLLFGGTTLSLLYLIGFDPTSALRGAIVGVVGGVALVTLASFLWRREIARGTYHGFRHE